MLRKLPLVLVSRAAYGAMCCDPTKHQIYQLEVLYRGALRAIIGLPRHTLVDELYRYAYLPTLADTIRARIAGANDRSHLTLQGRSLLRHDAQRLPDEPSACSPLGGRADY